jgi:L-ribulose-5-phosphate 4-epimerase
LHEALRERVWRANLDLVRHGLVILTFGNASGIDRKKGLVAIKPSGVSYEHMKATDMVVVDLEGKIVAGELIPSSDTPTHIELYKAFPSIGGIVHAHSLYATMFAQAATEIPCLGTTHADHFHGPVPVTRFPTRKDVETDYEKNTGKLIVRRFARIDPNATPAALVAGHGPFAWGKTPAEAVANALVLEQTAQTALGTLTLRPGRRALPGYILEKHFLRKHGPRAYYGQKRGDKP